ncbi:peptidase [Paraconexibacter sp. AEG42_29]|uniref:serine-type D-Ala-D-Ala carboxypeptidase n=1 Tax=Paraconexibacter sp. AEG42_29 TaxID=2997339 RepID=A0AAU7AYB4_9ACTN
MVVRRRTALRRDIAAAWVALLTVVCVVVGPGTAAHAAGPPPIDAPAAVLVEPATGDIVYQRGANDRRSIASTTKLMTALVALDKLNLKDVLSQVPYNPAGAESLAGLRTGDRMTVADFLRGLLLPSGNDAAQTLAVRTAGSRKAFVKLMNERAKKIGLKNTHFATPVGLDEPGNYSSASDLAALVLVLRTSSFFRETTNRPDAYLKVRGGRTIHVINRNRLIRKAGFVNGAKTGHTSGAGYCLVGSATRDGVTVVSVVLGTGSEESRDRNSLRLLRYGLQRYRVVTAVKQGESLAETAVKYRDGQSLELVASRSVKRTARRDEQLTTRLIGVPKEIEGPLAKGTRLGTILVRQRGKTVDRIALVAARDVPAATATERLSDYGRRPETLLLFAAFVGGSLLLVLLRRRSHRGGSVTGRDSPEIA